MPPSFEKTEIFISGVRILEPITMLTDILVTAVCLYAFYKLRKLKVKDKSLHYMLGFFSLLGIATAVGGIIGHSFNYTESLALKLPGKLTSMVAIWFLEQASIEYVKPLFSSLINKLMKVATILELIISMVLVLFFLKYKFIEIHAIFGLIVVISPIHAYVYSKTKSKVSRNIIQGIMAAMLGVLVFKAMVFPHKWFNHIDLSHVLMAFSAWIFYSASINIRSRGINKVEQ